MRVLNRICLGLFLFPYIVQLHRGVVNCCVGGIWLPQVTPTLRISCDFGYIDWATLSIIQRLVTFDSSELTIEVVLNCWLVVSVSLLLLPVRELERVIIHYAWF